MSARESTAEELSASPLDVRARFHEAVARPGQKCLILNRDNEVDGFRKLSAMRASTLESAYCVEVAPHLLAFDFDQENGLVLAAALGEALRVKGLLAVILRSGGPGRAHVWVSITADRERDVKAIAKGLGADDRSDSRIRPPFSPHRHGHAMELVEPKTPEEALERLEPIGSGPYRTGPKGKGLSTPRTAPEGIAPVSYDPPDSGWAESEERDALLRTPWPKGTRSGKLLELARKDKAARVPMERYVEDVLAQPFGIGEKIAMRRDARHYLENQYTKAETPPERTRDPKALAKIGRMQAAASEFLWGRYDRSLAVSLYVILAKAEETGRTELSYSCRQLAEDAGHTHTTARNHLNKLIAYGWLKKVKTGQNNLGTVYELQLPKTKTLVDETHGDAPPPPRGCESVLRIRGFLALDFQNAFGRRSPPKRPCRSWRKIGERLAG